MLYRYYKSITIRAEHDLKKNSSSDKKKDDPVRRPEMEGISNISMNVDMHSVSEFPVDVVRSSDQIRRIDEDVLMERI